MKKIIFLIIALPFISCSQQSSAVAAPMDPPVLPSSPINPDPQAPAPTPVTLDEQTLGPWLNLDQGGVAVGPAQTMNVTNPDGSVTQLYGSLENGTLLPANGEGYARVSSPTTSWGTGLMVTLVQNAAAEMTRTYYPGNMVYVGDIAMEHGGKYSPHKSHQSGLDADILFMGTNSYKSLVGPTGSISAEFDAEKNWQFWRLLVNQKILEKGKPISVVSMILVAPEIKKHLCVWAKERNLMANPLDVEVLRKLRPTAGHDDHMHIRLMCSPHHPLCKRQGAASDIGCE